MRPAFVLILFCVCGLCAPKPCSAQLGDAQRLTVQFDEDLFRSSVPVVLEVGHRCTVWMQMSNNGTIEGQFVVVLLAESTALYPLASNKEFLLRPGQVAKANFTLVGVKAVDEPQTLRAVVYAAPAKGIPMTEVFRAETQIRRIGRAAWSLGWAVLLALAVVVIICFAGLSRARMRRTEAQAS